MRYTVLCCAACIFLLLNSGCNVESTADPAKAVDGKSETKKSDKAGDRAASQDSTVDVAEPGNEKIAMGARLFIDKDDPTSGKVTVRIRLADSWHLYAMLAPDAAETQAKFTLSETPGVTPDGNWIVPVALPDKEDPLKHLWEGDLLFTQKVKLGELDPNAKLSVKLSYQICNDQGCMPPTDVVIPVQR